ncbi:MAG: hypothetical protein ACE5IK_14735 [Acidobacteriota bacterium]
MTRDDRPRERPDALGEALRSLPEHAAGDDFTARVLAALDQPARPPARRWLVPAAVAGLAATAMLLVVAAWHGAPNATDGRTIASLGSDGLVAPAPEAPRNRPAGHDTVPADRNLSVVDAAQRLADLKADHRQVLAEWRRLRRVAREREPVLYLGGTDGVDVVLDLRDLPPDRTHLTVTPAALRRANQMTY